MVLVQNDILAHQKCPTVKESIFKNKMKVLKKLKKSIGFKGKRNIFFSHNQNFRIKEFIKIRSCVNFYFQLFMCE
jgi:hypothetical protein